MDAMVESRHNCVQILLVRHHHANGLLLVCGTEQLRQHHIASVADRTYMQRHDGGVIFQTTCKYVAVAFASDPLAMCVLSYR